MTTAVQVQTTKGHLYEWPRREEELSSHLDSICSCSRGLHLIVAGVKRIYLQIAAPLEENCAAFLKSVSQ